MIRICRSWLIKQIWLPSKNLIRISPRQWVWKTYSTIPVPTYNYLSSRNYFCLQISIWRLTCNPQRQSRLCKMSCPISTPQSPLMSLILSSVLGSCVDLEKSTVTTPRDIAARRSLQELPNKVQRIYQSMRRKNDNTLLRSIKNLTSLKTPINCILIRGISFAS